MITVTRNTIKLLIIIICTTSVNDFCQALGFKICFTELAKIPV